MRKTLITLSLALTAAAGIARAEVVAEAIPVDFIQQFAPFAITLVQQQIPNPPVKVDASADKALGYHVKEMLGVVVMPDKNLTAKLIDEATDKEVPVAVLATKSLSIEEKDMVVNGDRLATAEFNAMFKIPVFFLSVKASGTDRTLQVYSKDGKPVATTTLKKQAGDANVPVGVKLSNIDLEKKKLDATLSLGGAYEGTLKLAGVDL